MEYTREEVKQALFDIHPSKSPGPDGLSARFFQKFWPVIGESVTTAALGILNHGENMQEWNKTLIVLIPKVDKPTTVKEFRPISLCNTTYKIISKVIVNRLRRVLSEVIDENQSAFLSGRQITDNIIVGFECMHWIQNKGRKTSYAALKLDMSKAYDRVEWRFLEAVMRRMNFPNQFVQLIMRCISTVSYSCVVNGQIFGEINPSRGLRQGDPLSPLLFVICAQGFSAILHGLCRSGILNAIKFGGIGPAISHLFFADDSLLFFKVEEKGVQALKNGLVRYEKASGQLINFDKSAISFSPFTTTAEIRRTQGILGIEVVQGHALYLGLPTVSTRNKQMQFGYVRDRVLNKVAAWQNKLLSAGGKEVLIKAVIQAIPTYAMSCFRIPDAICKDIDRICARFWWGDTIDKNRMHWTTWKGLCKPKDRGGLGFRHLSSFNKALLAKQVWRLITNPESLLAKVLRAKYHKNCSVLEAKVGSNASFVWRSLCWSRQLLCHGLRWKIGSGSSIRIFHDGFVSDLSKGIPQPRCFNRSNVKVASFINEEMEWDVALLQEVFLPNVVEAIARTPIRRGGVDRCFWSLDQRGTYTVKSGYLLEIGYFEPHASMASSFKEDWNDLVWKPNLPPKIKIFMWRAFMNFIPTPLNLKEHHVPIVGVCDFCRKDWGSTVHALYLCESTKGFWKDSIFWPILKRRYPSSMLELGREIRRKFSMGEYEIWAATSSSVWNFLCRKKHDSDGGVFEVGICLSERYLKAFQEARRAIQSSMSLGVTVGEKEWHPPEKGIYRLDVDASVKDETNLYGVGAVVRDYGGKLCAALAKPIQRPQSVLDAEINAVLYGVGLCIQEGLVPVVVYSDSLLAIRLLTSNKDKETYLEEKLPPLADIVNNGLVSGFYHMYRDANSVAHTLAHFGAECDDMVTWNIDFPQWLRALVN